ncbi:hypothetical protein Nepgr_025297 [Nepenthes gracilis]|uniref:GIR1-like zinc ribbon domain-containing protein n=1 Tax=Nepenthes gracilis TaxID=150966 RepID=A0AAD3T634_NEPGR|nr:hypothetical protein Nepgr_025297 [Nepenthes gracilis]
MVADVSMQIKREANSSVLATRDFLGAGFGIECEELDLDLRVPSGWEKRLDLKSGKVYIQRCSPSSSSDQKNFTGQTSPSHVQDLNLFHQQSKSTLHLFEDTSLDLKLMSSSSSSNNSNGACTLDKVKSALERAARESCKKRSISSISSVSSPSSSSFTSVVKESDDDGTKLPCKLSLFPSNQQGLMVAVACPSCLLYVLISKNNPRCPKCYTVIQVPVLTKKPRVDLNMSI